MPKRFKIKGTGKIIDYDKQADGSYKRRVSDEERVEQLKAEIAHLEGIRAERQLARKAQASHAEAGGSANPEIFKRLGMVRPQFTNQELEEMENE